MSEEKQVFWIGDSREVVRDFPGDVRKVIGTALQYAQLGEKHPDAKPLKGFGGATTLEIVSNYDGNAYRAVYTVKISDAVYVLHAFQKKSKKGIKTPKEEMDIVKRRFKELMAEKRRK